nr:OmpA family protein [Deltaproteobacteria bacterium]
TARLEGQDEQISAPSSLLPPPAAPLLKNDLVQGVLAEMTEVVLKARGQSKEQGGEEELEEEFSSSPAADIGDKKRSPGNLDATKRGKTALSQAPRYAKKMQIFFPIDSISPAPQYIEDLKIFSDRFQELSGGRIIIRGYTDSSGTARYNKKLAKFRADIVKTFLEARGVDVAKITTLGLISEASSLDGMLSPPTAEAARRVELEIVLPGSPS